MAKLTLAAGHQYDVTCTKGVGNGGTGKASITVTVTDKTAVPVVSTQDVSVANKFPLTKSADNTDQFNGILYTYSYCSGA